MRRWETCSWPGRCWKSLKSFTKGNRSPEDGLVTLTCTLVFDLFVLLRKEAKDDQLMAAQAHLKLGEVSVESGTTNQDIKKLLRGSKNLVRWKTCCCVSRELHPGPGRLRGVSEAAAQTPGG